MITLAKKIYQTYATYLPTTFPVHYYGMPNGKIYLVYSRICKRAFGNSGLEFVFAEHKDFLYDYKKENIIANNSNYKSSRVYTEQIDDPNTKFSIVAINCKLQSYREAQLFINRIAGRMRQIA